MIYFAGRSGESSGHSVDDTLDEVLNAHLAADLANSGQHSSNSRGKKDAHRWESAENAMEEGALQSPEGPADAGFPLSEVRIEGFHHS